MKTMFNLLPITPYLFGALVSADRRYMTYLTHITNDSDGIDTVLVSVQQPTPRIRAEEANGYVTYSKKYLMNYGGFPVYSVGDYSLCRSRSYGGWIVRYGNFVAYEPVYYTDWDNTRQGDGFWEVDPADAFDWYRPNLQIDLIPSGAYRNGANDPPTPPSFRWDWEEVWKGNGTGVFQYIGTGTQRTEVRFGPLEESDSDDDAEEQPLLIAQIPRWS